MSFRTKYMDKLNSMDAKIKKDEAFWHDFADEMNRDLVRTTKLNDANRRKFINETLGYIAQERIIYPNYHVNHDAKISTNDHLDGEFV